MSQSNVHRPLLNDNLGEKGVNQYQQPSKLEAYFRLTRLHLFPIGSDLIWNPALMGLTMAAYKTSLPPKELAILSVFALVGGTLAHSAACIINDICDIDFDAKVDRTKNRPLVTGYISVWSAFVYLLAWTAPIVYIISLPNELTLKIGLIGIFPFHALYPLMKRVTYWPQAWLGFAMNWSFPVAWAAVTNSLDWIVLVPIMTGCIAWTILYDTIYAFQDIQDDLKCGVKSTAILFGEQNAKSILSAFAAVMVASFAYAGIQNHQSYGFILSIGATACHLLWQLVTVDLKNGKDCFSKFRANGDLGYIILVGLLVDYYIKVVA